MTEIWSVCALGVWAAGLIRAMHKSIRQAPNRPHHTYAYTIRHKGQR